MSKKQSENERYSRMLKIERELNIEKYKNIDYYENYNTKKKKLLKNLEYLHKYKKNLNFYDDYDYM